MRGPYNESESAKFPINMRAAARELGISQQRLSRVVCFLQIPVTRQGYTLLLDRPGFRKAKRLIQNGGLKKGPKKKGELKTLA